MNVPLAVVTVFMLESRTVTTGIVAPVVASVKWIVRVYSPAIQISCWLNPDNACARIYLVLVVFPAAFAAVNVTV